MKQLTAAALVLALLAGLMSLSARAHAPLPFRSEAAPPAIVVGTFDSRAVAIAYVRSKTFSEYVGAQQADIGRALERARAAGDDDLVRALDELGPAMQRRIHEQGFSTAPVDDLLEKIADRIPAIAEETGVDLIVSKWQLVHRASDANTVDVTEAFVREFDPDDATWKAVREIVKQEPVSREDAGHGH